MANAEAKRTMGSRKIANQQLKMTLKFFSL